MFSTFLLTSDKERKMSKLLSPGNFAKFEANIFISIIMLHWPDVINFIANFCFFSLWISHVASKQTAVIHRAVAIKYDRESFTMRETRRETDKVSINIYAANLSLSHRFNIKFSQRKLSHRFLSDNIQYRIAPGQINKLLSSKLHNRKLLEIKHKSQLPQQY